MKDRERESVSLRPAFTVVCFFLSRLYTHTYIWASGDLNLANVMVLLPECDEISVRREWRLAQAQWCFPKESQLIKGRLWFEKEERQCRGVESLETGLGLSLEHKCLGRRVRNPKVKAYHTVTRKAVGTKFGSPGIQVKG